ncbi:MAG: Zn-dependent membrane protease YugP [Cocleimonas sp.]|jgi:Zn-dependent membrane protease YugP
MPILILLLVIVVIIFLPQWWAKNVFARHSEPQDHIQGTGGELAKHLLKRFEMYDVDVEETDEGNDHYDPESKTVRLSPKNYHDKSLTAVAVATHEVGHAIQHHNKEAKLELRTRLIKTSMRLEKVGSIIMMIMPIAVLLTRSPVAGFIFFATGFLTIAGATVIHLVTLPVEWDASFGKALPILKEGYILEEEHKAVDQILKAAAFTYVAASLMSILNVWRWFALLRR